jgi:hypothetical protein
MVQITIDTDKESPQRIRHIIAFLQSIVGESPTDIPQPQFSEPKGDMFSVFGDQPSTPTSPSLPTSSLPSSDSSPSVSDLLNDSTDYLADEESTDDDDDDDEKNFFSLMEY